MSSSSQTNDLKNRIIFTIFILAVYRFGTFVPIPGIDPEQLQTMMSGNQKGLLGMFNVFAGGAVSRMAIFALGIMPYISSSIIIQLLTGVSETFKNLKNQGEIGRKKITQYTRYGTVLLATIQGYGVSVGLENSGNVVTDPGLFFKITTVITLVAGTIFLMWLGEQITQRGIGNGISLIIMVGIISRLPFVIGNEIRAVISGEKLFISELVLMGIMFLVICFVVLLTQGTRKIPVQYAKRVVGRKVYGGQNTHIPLKVNTAGVMPIIFAQSIMFIPSTVSTFFADSDFSSSIMRWFSFEHPVYWIFFGLMIVFFTYFYTAIAFDPIQVSSQMKQQGGFIPGVRPGKKTAEYIDNILSKVTLPGSVALAIVAIFPYILMQTMDVEYDLASFFGGTSLLIIVGVALDTLQQLESHLMMRHYDGFLTKGKIRVRRGM